LKNNVVDEAWAIKIVLVAQQQEPPHVVLTKKVPTQFCELTVTKQVANKSMVVKRIVMITKNFNNLFLLRILLPQHTTDSYIYTKNDIFCTCRKRKII
jgi:hypothetical protein